MPIAAQEALTISREARRRFSRYLGPVVISSLALQPAYAAERQTTPYDASLHIGTIAATMHVSPQPPPFHIDPVGVRSANLMPKPLPTDISPPEYRRAVHRLVQAQVKNAQSASTATSFNTLYTAWSKVATCEEGGWVGAASPDFPDSLGITSENWYANGGGSAVSPAAQIAVAERLTQRLGISIPDQDGCQPGGW